MPVLTFPEPDRVKPLSVADAMAQWAQIDQMKQSGQMNQMRIADMQRKQQQQDQLRGLYANGQRPTADQLYSVDPELGMEYENNQARNQKSEAEMYMKTMPVLKDISNQIRNKVAQSGITPDSPQFQQTLDSIAAPYRPYISKMLGKPDDGKPTDWNAINMLADFSGAAEKQDWIVANDSQRGSFMLNKFTGEVKPLEHGGRQIRPPQYSPDLQGEIMAAKEGAKGVEVTDPQGRTYRDNQQNASAGRIGLKRRPADNIPQMGEEDALLLMKQARDDNPDTVGRDRARAVLEGLAAKSGGGIPYDEPVKGPTPGEVEADKQTAKNDAELAMKRQERIRAVQNLLGQIDRPIDGESVEDLIGRSTGGMIEKTRDSIAGAFNSATEGGRALAKLRPVQEWAVSLVPRMEGPQSNFDVERYKAMAGDIANPDLPVEIRKESYKALKAMLHDFLKEQGGDSKPAGGKDDIHSKAEAILRGKK